MKTFDLTTPNSTDKSKFVICTVPAVIDYYLEYREPEYHGIYIFPADQFPTIESIVEHFKTSPYPLESITEYHDPDGTFYDHAHAEATLIVDLSMGNPLHYPAD